MVENELEEQRTIGWYRARMGKITGSKVYDLMGKGRGKDEKFSQTAMTYLYQLAAERSINKRILDDDALFEDYVTQMSYTTKQMQWGIDMEAPAKVYVRGLHPEWTLTETGSCQHPSIPNFASSPDCIIEGMEEGGIAIMEVKCPNPSTHMRYSRLITGGDSLKSVEPRYYWQMMAEMACTGALAGLFVSYCPWLGNPIHTQRIERNEEDISTLCMRVEEANKEIDNIMSDIGCNNSTGGNNKGKEEEVQ